MFLLAPTGNGMPLRVAPLASVLLVLLNIGMAAWVLPTADRVRWERRLVSFEVANARLEAKPDGGTSDRLESARLVARTARLAALEARDPFQVWGYRLGAAPWRALAALFVHADPLHLVANLLLLALVGAGLEQAWGPAAVLALFLAAGSTALVVDACTGPPTLVVGASGGVAALLGAYCVCFRRQPLRWGYVHLVYLRPVFGSFRVPCLLVAALWLTVQLLGAWLAARSGDHSIAFVSHLTGFGLGALVAALHAAMRHVLLHDSLPVRATSGVNRPC